MQVRVKAHMVGKGEWLANGDLKRAATFIVRTLAGMDESKNGMHARLN
jgi:hypothetical protein